ncbi:hypothetical protein GSY74_05115, partial [Sulfurovum sp. bin170]|nr:hypothetical protein [Sulfurovum sp. bin170]
MRDMIKKSLALIFLTVIGLMTVGCGSDRAADALDDNSSKGSAVAGVSHMGEDDPKDTDGDGLSDEYELEHGLDPFSSDTDEDGLDDGYEMSHDDVNVTNPDTDGDGLLDGEEVNEHYTQPNNSDTDGDGLNDYDEVKTHETDPNQSDTDGDCLLDSFEILNYETNATLKDTDGDEIDDGVEIYSYTDELNLTCLTTPETLEQGYNPNPAMDGIPNKEDDIINALDPTNDSDGDGQSNIKENNCTEGDPKDRDKMCPFIHETEEGKILTEHGYSYVPGGFDVDDDGIDEGGFWMSRYQARSSSVEITSEEIIEEIGNVNQYISKNFKVLNRNIDVTSYQEAPLSGTIAGAQLIFDEESVAGKERISNFTPYLALVCLSKYRLEDSNGTELDIEITMPTLKQYIHVKMLLDADMANNGDGRHIRNGLLGIDKNVPLINYNLIIDEFGETQKEFVRNLIQLRDIHGDRTFDIKDAPDWWDIEITKFKSSDGGANSTQ